MSLFPSTQSQQDKEVQLLIDGLLRKYIRKVMLSDRKWMFYR